MLNKLKLFGLFAFDCLEIKTLSAKQQVFFKAVKDGINEY